MSHFSLQADLFSEDIKQEATRVGFGRGLKAAGEADDRIVALSADLTDSTQISLFKEAFPGRFVQIGVAEQNLVTVASGLAGQVRFRSRAVMRLLAQAVTGSNFVPLFVLMICQLR